MNSILSKATLHKPLNTNQLKWILGDLEITKLLVKKGANINDKDHNGMTALHYSSGRGNCK